MHKARTLYDWRIAATQIAYALNVHIDTRKRRPVQPDDICPMLKDGLRRAAVDGTVTLRQVASILGVRPKTGPKP